MNPPHDYDDEDENGDRVHLVKTANRLSMAFYAWAVVVGVVGALAMVFMLRFMDRQEADHAMLLIVKERQDTVLRRLDKLEDK